jgi:hypothetical protein
VKMPGAAWPKAGSRYWTASAIHVSGEHRQ